MKKQEQAMQRLAEYLKGPAQFESATVTEVDENTMTCSVVLANDTELNNVRLKAAIDNVKDGLVEIPEVNSSVIVGRIGNNSNARFIVAFSKVTKVVFYGGSKGPIVIWEDKLKTELDKVKTLLTHILNVINGTAIPEPGSGANSALQFALKTAITGDSLPSFENLTDNKVLH